MNIDSKMTNIVIRGLKIAIIFLILWYVADFVSTLMISPLDPAVKGGIILVPALILVTLSAPKWSFWALLFIRPLLEPLWEYRFMGASALGLFSFVYIIIAVYMVTRSKEFKLIPDKIMGYYFFMLIAVFSTYNAIDIPSSITYLTRYLAILSLFLLGYNFTKTFQDVLNIVKVVVMSSIAPIIYGLYQVVTGTGVQAAKEFQPLAGVARVNSFFNLSNGFAYYLGMIIFLIIFLLYYSTRKNEKIYYLPLLAGALVCLFFTYVRTIWITFILGMSLLSIYDKRIKKYFIIGIIIAAPLTYHLVIERFTDIFVEPEYGTNSLEFRSGIGKKLLENAVPVHLFIGHGSGSAMAVSIAYTEYKNIPHNDFLRVLLENGILGLGTYLFFLGNFGIYFFCLIRKKINYRANIVFFVIFVFYLMTSGGQNLFSQISTSGYLLCFLGVAIKMNEISKESGDIIDEN